MSNYDPQEALKQYRELGLESEINSASPHRLIQILFEAALTRLAGAQGALQSNDVVAKEEHLAAAVKLIGGLRESLDMQAPGDLPVNLDNLYEYMELTLAEAAQTNDPVKVAEVVELLKTLKSGWDGIAP